MTTINRNDVLAALASGGASVVLRRLSAMVDKGAVSDPVDPVAIMSHTIASVSNATAFVRTPELLPSKSLRSVLASSRNRYQNTGPKKESGPRGWVGALLAHGAACQAFELSYLKSRNTHLSPVLRVKKVHKHASGNEVEIKGTGDFLMVQKFAEPQSPIWSWMGPDIGLDEYGFGPFNTELRTLLNACVNSSNTKDEVETAIRLYGWCTKGGWDQVTPGAEHHRAGHEGRPPKTLEGLRPAWVVRKYWARRGNKDFYDSRTGTAGNKILSKLDGNKLTADPWFRENEWFRANDRMLTWDNRVLQWYRRAQWLVWSCEMLRCHANGGFYDDQKYATNGELDRLPSVPPVWWAEFVNSWGIAIPERKHLYDRHNYESYAREKDWKVATALRVDMSYTAWAAIARELIDAARVPGDPERLGQQIRPRGEPQTILCFPENAEGEDRSGIAPPTSLDIGMGPIINGYEVAMAGQWRQGVDVTDWGDTFLKWWNAGISAIASVGGVSAEAMAAIASIQAVYGAANKALRCIAALSGGGASASSVVGALLSVGEAIAAATGSKLELSELVPEEAWKILSTAGDVIDDVEGVIGMIDKADLMSLKSELTSLVKDYDWDYLDETFGGFFL